MSEGAGKVRVTFECDDHAGMIAWAKAFLEEEGYIVKRPDPLHAPETPSQFIKRIGISFMTFSRRIKRADCPQNFDCHRTPATGRIMWLRASPELEIFMQRTVGAVRKNSQPKEENKDATKK